MKDKRCRGKMIMGTAKCVYMKVLPIYKKKCKGKSMIECGIDTVKEIYANIKEIKDRFSRLKDAGESIK
jgi:hypothetical protein